MIEGRHVTLAHGNGGRFMRELIEEVFVRHLANPALDAMSDAAHLPLPPGEVLVTTDGFTVQPLEFPGGDIGSLAVHGTVNDLAVAGALPAYLSLNAFIEEGLEFAQLDRLVASMAAAARDCGVQIAAGDTKVLRRGEGGGVYFATTGVGVRRPGLRLDMKRIRARDVVLVSGPVGDHGTAVLLAREQYGLRGELASDAASVLPLTAALLELPGLRFMRDPTRGGLATVAQEIARATGLCVRLHGPAIPIREPVAAVCEMLGFDPLYLACEGRVVAVLAPEDAERALEAWRALPEGQAAARIGVMEGGARDGTPLVVLETELGGERCLEELEDDPLPASADLAEPILVLGIGNVLLGDEGAGVHAMRRLEQSGPYPRVQFADGGTLSFTLAGLIESSPALIVLDAAEMKAAPGSVAVFEGSRMDEFIGSERKRSVHEVSLLDLMAVAALGGRLPGRRALIGIQPASIDWSDSPSEVVAQAIAQACERARELIERWQA